MKKTAVWAVIFLLLFGSLTSCRNETYVFERFFGQETLDGYGVSALPPVEGTLLYTPVRGFVAPCVYVRGDGEEPTAYAAAVLCYLSEKGFGFFGTLGEMRRPIGAIPALEASYYVRDAATLADFYGDTEEHGPGYYFVYADGGWAQNEEGEFCLADGHCFYISLSPGSYLYEEDREFPYDFSVGFFANESFWQPME